MSKIIELINNAVDYEYFSIQYKHLPPGDNELFDGSICVYHAIMLFNDDVILRIKRYSNKEYNIKDEDDFLGYFDDLIMRNVIFSKPTNKKFKNILKTFADCKNDILEIRKNKVNE